MKQLLAGGKVSGVTAPSAPSGSAGRTTVHPPASGLCDQVVTLITCFLWGVFVFFLLACTAVYQYENMHVEFVTGLMSLNLTL